MRGKVFYESLDIARIFVVCPPLRGDCVQARQAVQCIAMPPVEHINPMIRVEGVVIRLMEQRVVTYHSVRLVQVMAFDVEHITCGTFSPGVGFPTSACIDCGVHASCDAGHSHALSLFRVYWRCRPLEQTPTIQSASGARRQTSSRINIIQAPIPHLRVRKKGDHKGFCGTFRNEHLIVD